MACCTTILSMRTSSGLFVLAFATCTAILRADPPSTPSPEQVFIAEQLAELEQEGQVGTVLKARPLDQIIKLEFEDGELRCRLLAQDAGEQATIPLEGVRGICQILRLGDHLPMPDAVRVSIHTLDAEDAKAINVEIVNIGRLQLDVVLNTPSVAMTTQMMLPDAGGVVLDENEPGFHVQIVSDMEQTSTPSIHRTAATVGRLIDENHSQLTESIGEALDLLKARHLLSGMSEREVQNMFASNAPTDHEVMVQVEQAVNALMAESEVGEERLRELLKTRGMLAVTALSRLPREKWSADLTMRVDNALAPYLVQTSQAAGNVNSNPVRLVDLLYWPDAGIRSSALARIKELASPETDFNPAGDPYKQAARIEALRDRLK